MLNKMLAAVAVVAASSTFALADASPKYEVKRMGPRHRVIIVRTDRPTTIDAPYALTGRVDQRQTTVRSMGHIGPRHWPASAR